jgi:hypothetical protein
MAVLSTGQLTLADHAKRLDPDGKVPAIAELLSQTNEILEDMVFVPGNLPTGHRVVIRTGLPTIYYRALNQGVPTSKSQTTQVDEQIGMLEARSHIDAKLMDLAEDKDGFRLSEDSAFIEAMNQAQAQGVFYGNPATDPRQYLGLMPRYGVISGAGNAANIIDAGGTGTDNASIVLVGWGESTAFGIFPKGSRAGLQVRDLGEDDVLDSNGNTYRAVKSLYQWDNGLVVKDWRYIVRICNIDVSDLVGQTGTQAASAATVIINLMARAVDRLPSRGMCRPAFYMNRTMHSMLRIAAMNKTSNVLAIEQGLNQFGQSHSWTSFDGIPLRKVDALLNSEARVV